MVRKITEYIRFMFVLRVVCTEELVGHVGLGVGLGVGLVGLAAQLREDVGVGVALLLQGGRLVGEYHT